MLLPVVCPLLITPGQCAEFVDEESEDLTGVWPLGYCQELLIVCIYLCGQFLKNRKVANVTKTGKDTAMPPSSIARMVLMGFQCLYQISPIKKPRAINSGLFLIVSW